MKKVFNTLCTRAFFGVKNFIEEEKGAVDLIAIVVLIGIVIILAAAFRGAIVKLLNTLFGNITASAGTATTGTETITATTAG